MATETKRATGKDVGFLTVVIPLSDKRALAELAAERDRSLSAEARRAITAHLKACER